MKNTFFILTAFAAAFLSVSCSETEDDGRENPYGKENFYITTHPEVVAPEELDKAEDDISRFHLIIAFTEWGRLQMFTQTYISFEMYSENQLRFVESATDEMGGMWLSDIVFSKNDRQDILPYPWYQMTIVSAPGEGEYEFAVKFYYPERDQTCITPRYRMKLWHENGQFKAKTTLIE